MLLNISFSFAVDGPITVIFIRIPCFKDSRFKLLLGELRCWVRRTQS